jgi:catechol 2,3-dioxygenase
MPPEPARLPAETHLGRVRLQVSDLDRSIRYYEQVLGLRILERRAGEAVLGDQVSNAPLVELRERPGANPVRRRGHLGLFHFAILLPDRAALGRLLRHLASIDAQVGASDHLVSEALYLHDPDGLGIEVYADRARSSWLRRDGEMVVETKPLDIESVVAAGGTGPWTGMPEGTVMGHMHLHVSNLEQAAAFYRDALGLDATVWSYPGALFLSAGGYHHHLGLNTWAGEDAPRPTDTDARLLEWEMVLPAGAVDTAAKRIEGAGHAVKQSGDGLRVDDPWGTTLLLRS